MLDTFPQPRTGHDSSLCRFAQYGSKSGNETFTIRKAKGEKKIRHSNANVKEKQKKKPH